MMKKIACIAFIMLLNTLVFSQESIPVGYFPAPGLTLSGDFDGDGNTDILRQFITDSLNNPVKYIIQLGEDDPPTKLADYYGYGCTVTLNGKTTNLGSTGLGFYCLINLGDVNHTKGDEIAVVADNADYSNLNHCSIYSFCQGRWQEVFRFSVNENVFFTEGYSVFTDIPGRLEKHGNSWFYNDYLDYVTDGNANLKPLEVTSCNK